MKCETCDKCGRLLDIDTFACDENICNFCQFEKMPEEEKKEINRIRTLLAFDGFNMKVV